MHVLMGQNGSGKSTFAQVIAGNPAYTVDKGSLTLADEDLLTLLPDARARLGLFVSFQQPLSVPGVSTTQFIRTALTERNSENLRPSKVKARLAAALPRVGLAPAVAERDVNDGFSGGEMKRFELAQLLLLGAQAAVLDEIDSGLDVDGVAAIAKTINTMRQDGMALLVITHNPAVLEPLNPDSVSIMQAGRIAATGGPELGARIAKEGYAAFMNHES